MRHTKTYADCLGAVQDRGTFGYARQGGTVDGRDTFGGPRMMFGGGMVGGGAGTLLPLPPMNLDEVQEIADALAGGAL